LISQSRGLGDVYKRQMKQERLFAVNVNPHFTAVSLNLIQVADGLVLTIK
jgi:hypothetical protein